MRDYARSRGLREQPCLDFVRDHLPFPAAPRCVLAGPIPGSNLGGLFVTFAATEASPRAIAVVVELEDPEEAEGLAGLQAPEGFRVEISEATVAIWRPVAGNMSFEAPMFDRFRAEAGALLAQVGAGEQLLAQVGEDSQDPAMAAVGGG